MRNEVDEDTFIKAILGQLSINSWKRYGVVAKGVNESFGRDRGDLTAIYLMELEKMDCVESRQGECAPHEVLMRGTWYTMEWRLSGLGKQRLDHPAVGKDADLTPMPA